MIQSEYFRERQYDKFKTLCIDVVNTLVVQEDCYDSEIIDLLISDKQSLEETYILIEKEVSQNLQGQEQDEFCCLQKQIKQNCMCKYNLYRIKPYAINFLRTINSFYEVVGFSKLPSNEINLIIDHLEHLLNKHLNDQQLIWQSQNPRKKNQTKPKEYFQFRMVEQTEYLYIPEMEQWVLNLQMLLSNRQR